MTLALIEVRQPARKALLVAVRGPLEIGRDCDGLLLLDPEVSRRHVQVEVIDGMLVVTDLGSTNGTTVNGIKIDGPTRITENDVVRLGGTEVQPIAVDRDGGRGRCRARAPVAPASRPSPGLGCPCSGGGDAVVKGHEDDTAARMTSIDAVAAAVDEDAAERREALGERGHGDDRLLRHRVVHRDGDAARATRSGSRC